MLVLRVYMIATFSLPSPHLKVKMFVTQLCPPLQWHGMQPASLLYPWNPPGKNTGVDSHSLLQWIFLNLGLNLYLSCLLHWQADSLTISSQACFILLWKPIVFVIKKEQYHYFILDIFSKMFIFSVLDLFRVLFTEVKM